MPQAPLMWQHEPAVQPRPLPLHDQNDAQSGTPGGPGTEAASMGIREAVFREAAVVQMTWPGAPTLYYGDEAGLCGFTDPDCRRTYPWAARDKEPIRFHRELIRMRKETSCLRNGSLIRLTDAPGMLSYGRFIKESSAVVTVNNRETPMKVRIPVIYAGVPADANMKLRFQTRRNGFLAHPRTTPTGCAGRES